MVLRKTDRNCPSENQCFMTDLPWQKFYSKSCLQNPEGKK